MNALQAYEALMGEEGAKLSDYTEHDAAAVFVDAVLADPEQLEELWLDALSDLHGENKKGELKNLLAGIGSINKEINGVQSFAKISDGLCVAFSSALTHKSSNVGQEVFSAIKTFVQKYVDKYAYEWLAEAIAYEHEVIESTKADWEYELGRERRMGL